jgi:hypothetical protein
MNVKKIIGRIEKMKGELASILKEVVAEDKRIQKLRKRGEKARDKIQAKIWALDSQDRTVPGEKSLTRQDKLTAQRDAICAYDNARLGETGDYDEDSVLGALGTVQHALNTLVYVRGKRLRGHLPDYEEDLASDETPRE